MGLDEGVDYFEVYCYGKFILLYICIIGLIYERFKHTH
jgi:hypothetical protein